MKRPIFLMLLLLTTNGVAHAEGGSCPAGYYPIGGQGVAGCAPIPGYGDGSENGEKFVPQVRWSKTWGAIAADDELGVLGAVTGYISKGDAKKAAIRECLARGGGNGCTNILTYQNQCAVVITGSNGQSYSGAESIKLATENAMKRCLAKNSANCRLYYSACSDPIRNR